MSIAACTAFQSEIHVHHFDRIHPLEVDQIEWTRGGGEGPQCRWNVRLVERERQKHPGVNLSGWFHNVLLCKLISVNGNLIYWISDKRPCQAFPLHLNRSRKTASVGNLGTSDRRKRAHERFT